MTHTITREATRTGSYAVVTVTDSMDDAASFAVHPTGVVVRAFDTDTDSPGVAIEAADFLAVLTAALAAVDGLAAGVADVLAAHNATPTPVEVPITATPAGPATRLYALPDGSVATIEQDLGGWAVIWWGDREDYDADAADRPSDWSDRATCSVMVGTEADALAELGEGAQLVLDHPAATGCNLSREDFDTDDRCADGGLPGDHPTSVPA